MDKVDRVVIFVPLLALLMVLLALLLGVNGYYDAATTLLALSAVCGGTVLYYCLSQVWAVWKTIK